MMDPNDMNIVRLRHAASSKPQRTRIASLARVAGRQLELRWGAGRRKRVLRLQDPWLLAGLYVALRGHTL